MDIAPRGIKRKRNPDDDVGLSLRRKLHHELKEVHKATKKAKIFEIRKMIKRLKFLRLKEIDALEIKDLEAQLLVLKHLDTETVGNTVFKTKISKNKLLYSNEQVKVAVEEEIDSCILPLSQPGTPAYRAQSRLLSSKTLAERVTNAVKGIQLKVYLQEGEQTTGPSQEQAGQLDMLNITHGAFDTESDENSLKAGTVQEDGSVGGPGGEWESGSVGEVDAALLVDEEAAHDKTNANAGTKLSRSQSTFLPSLSVGFIPGDTDDSDWEDEAKVAEVGKKNRRGQRARRAIWEKKYGRNANHKKKELDGKQKVKKHTDNKRQNNQHERLKRPNIKADFKTDRKQAEPPPSRFNDRPLHPSWEAKKRLKEQMNPHIVPSQGKKIVF